MYGPDADVLWRVVEPVLREQTLASGPGAQCGSSARWDLCGGPPVRAVPTAIKSRDNVDTTITNSEEAKRVRDETQARIERVGIQAWSREMRGRIPESF